MSTITTPKKIILSSIILFVAFTTIALPKNTNAFFVPTGDIPLGIKETLGDISANFVAKALLATFTDEIVNWINEGFDGPLFSTNFQDDLRDIADNAGGIFLEKLLGANNPILNALCSPFKFSIGLSLPQAEPFELKAKCTLSDIEQTLEFYDDFSKGGWGTWLEVSRPENNPYGVMLLAIEEQSRTRSQAQQDLTLDLNLGSGFQSMKKCAEYECMYWDCSSYDTEGACEDSYCSVPGTSENGAKCEKYTNITPGKAVEEQLVGIFGSGIESLEMADEISEVIGALVNLALNTAMNGILGAKERRETEFADRIEEEISNPGSVTNRIIALKNRFNDYRTIKYESGDERNETAEPESYLENPIFLKERNATTTYIIHSEKRILDKTAEFLYQILLVAQGENSKLTTSVDVSVNVSAGEGASASGGATGSTTNNPAECEIDNILLTGTALESKMHEERGKVFEKLTAINTLFERGGRLDALKDMLDIFDDQTTTASNTYILDILGEQLPYMEKQMSDIDTTNALREKLKTDDKSVDVCKKYFTCYEGLVRELVPDVKNPCDTVTGNDSGGNGSGGSGESGQYKDYTISECNASSKWRDCFIEIIRWNGCESINACTDGTTEPLITKCGPNGEDYDSWTQSCLADSAAEVGAPQD